ncbi:hypothetical protein [Paludisphaera soli]|uniref:hypothetical protein n=1 Tax=Paludisphaera soli TaxID=2712865 RepID=UPI0013ED1431|nr:hypothetical protein [Paludisphaera soli]
MLPRRFTTRRLMALILAFAAVLGLAIPAAEVYRTKEYHVHVGVDPKGPNVASWGGIEPPFWPRYLKRLAGRPWRGVGPCGFATGFEVDHCEFAHPEMRVEFGGRAAYQFSGEHAKRLEEIGRVRGRRVTVP